VAGPGKSSVFRHADPCTGFSYVAAESGLWQRDRIKRSEIRGRKTVFGAKETNHNKINVNLGLPDDPATKALFEAGHRVCPRI
jgi:hypothetical protein